MGLHEIEKLPYSKRNGVLKRLSTEWEKIFTSNISDKWLITRICSKFVFNFKLLAAVEPFPVVILLQL
jgi:hypothetical protein